MAIAQNFDSLSTANVQSPWLASQLVEESKIVNIDSATSSASGSSRKRKAQLTSEAPRLTPATVNPVTGSTNPLTAGQTFLTLLAIYMASVILTQIDLTKNQSTVSQAQFSSQNGMIALSQNEYNNAVKAYNTYEAELQAESHESLWEKICGYIAAALCCVLAAFTGGATAFLAAGLLTAFMLSGGEQDLASYLNNTLGIPDWASSLLIALVGTALTCGASGACSAAVDSGADETATAATDTATSAVEDTVEDSVSEDVDSVEDAISNNNLNQTAETSQKDILTKLKNALLKAGEKGFSKGNIISTGGQFFTSVNPLGNILQAMGVPQTWAQSIGLGVSVLAFGGAEIYMAKAGTMAAGADSLIDSLKAKLGSTGFYSLQAGLDLARLSTQGAEAYYSVESGITQLAMASTTEAIGQSQANLAFYNGLIEILQSTSSDKTFTNLMNSYAQIENSFDNLIEPGRIAAQIL